MSQTGQGTHQVSAKALMTSDELEARLKDPNIRIYDCSVNLVVKEGGGYQSDNHRDAWLAEHIPGAGYIDLMEELSDTEAEFPFMMPSDDKFIDAMSRYGVGPETDVVLYNRGPGWWAMRTWWMLRAFGFDRAAVLDGGWDKWQVEERPTSSGDEHYQAATFVPGRRRQIFVGAPDVLKAIDEPGTLVVNALSPAIHRGEGKAYARPGRIKGSVNVPAPNLFNEDLTLHSEGELKRHFDSVDALQAEEVINYCGGGISATADAFALHLLGHDRVLIYDGSLSEWVRDPSLPMETG